MWLSKISGFVLFSELFRLREHGHKPAKIIRIIYYVLSTNTATDCLVIVWILRTVRASHKHSDCLDRASHYEP